ncbi:MAG: AgmX/PglI C-terminal domain-containing protein [Nannocystaceae bacterium]|nr:AgmX/PglI C-terminal domain-containing protein [Nannocystaceae bacterium]
MSRALRFEVWRDDQLVDATTLTQSVIKIGRLPSSHLRIDDESIARMHAVLEVQGDQLRLVDLGSSVGTTVNGERVEKSAVVQVGDAISMGRYSVRLGAATRVVRRPTALSSVESVERVDAPDVAEVMAVYGDTVLDVQHLGGRTSRKLAYGCLALGGVLLLGGAGYVASQTVLRAEAWRTYEVQKAEAAISGRPAPQVPGSAWSGLGVVLGLAGLVPLGFGLVRLGDRDRSRYTIGEGDQTSFATPAASLPTPAGFPLVAANEGGETCVRFTAGMEGDVTVEGHRYRLHELVSSGQARVQGSAFAFSLPTGARCRIQHDDVTFHVNGVKPGRIVAGRGSADKNFWLYNAASLIGIGTLLGLAQLAMPAQTDFSLDDALSSDRFVGYIQQPDVEEDADEPDEQPLDDGKAKSDPGDPGRRAPGTQGKMGKPDSKVSAPKRFAQRGPKDAMRQMSRNFSPDIAARQAGILGMIQSDSGHFLASPNGGNFSVGNEDADLWGNMTGTELGESSGMAGLGLAGTGRGGGGNADGLLGLGNVGLIGTRGSGGDATGYTHGGGAGFKTRTRVKPIVRAAKSTIRGALDKDLIRRVVRAHINQVRHCYNQALARDPTARGKVAVQFTIGRTGKVPLAVVSETTLKDRAVGNCIAKAVRRWKFPSPEGGGNVMVTYPFVLNPG